MSVSMKSCFFLLHRLTITGRGHQRINYCMSYNASVVLPQRRSSDVSSLIRFQQNFWLSCVKSDNSPGIKSHLSSPLQVFTVEEMMPHLQEVSGVVSKNLFLKDKKKKGLWLVSARHDRQVSLHPAPPLSPWAPASSPWSSPVPPQVNLNELAKKLGVGSGNLRFADEAAMLEKLKVRCRHNVSVSSIFIYGDTEKYHWPFDFKFVILKIVDNL